MLANTVTDIQTILLRLMGAVNAKVITLEALAEAERAKLTKQISKQEEGTHDH